MRGRPLGGGSAGLPVDAFLKYQACVLTQGMKVDFVPHAFHCPQLGMVRGEQGGGIDGIVGNAVRVGVDEALELSRIIRRDPARQLVA